MIFSFRDLVSLFKRTEELPGADRGEEATPITSGSAILKIYCAALPNRVEASLHALSSRHRGCPPLFLHPWTLKMRRSDAYFWPNPVILAIGKANEKEQSASM
jgi:hypothetical protein